MSSETLLCRMKTSFPWGLFLILVLGAFFRFLCYRDTPVINPDGVLYIHQARAIYYGQLEELTTCSMSYLSIYPLGIAGAYLIFHQWIMAAKFVSILFGTLTLIPSYLLLAAFFERRTALLGALAFSLIPVMVLKSGDVLRGPVFWFFLAMGLYFFVAQMKGDRCRLRLSLSSLCLLLAAWARVEALLFVMLTGAFLLFSGQDRKLEKCLFYVAPLCLVLLIALSGCTLWGTGLDGFLRWEEVVNKLTGPFTGYETLRGQLLPLIHRHEMGLPEYFLEHARHLVWLIALGTLCSSVMKAYFYPFFVVFLLGLPGLFSRMSRDSRLSYLGVLSGTALLLLYLHILQTWIMHTRFLILFMIPAVFVLGFGLERIIQWTTSHLRITPSVVMLLLGGVLVAASSAKIVKPHEADKAVFKRIGEHIASREGHEKIIPVACSSHTIRWVAFYANLGYEGAPCPQRNYQLTEMAHNGYGAFVGKLKSAGVKYFLWEEKHWPEASFDFRAKVKAHHFIERGRWHHPDTGGLILFELL